MGKDVTQEAFEKWLKTYPRELRVSVVRVVEPEVHLFIDDSLGKYPDSIVASYQLNVDQGKLIYDGPTGKSWEGIPRPGDFQIRDAGISAHPVP